MNTEPQSVVYFVQIGKHIKIGFSTNLEKRLKSFLTTVSHVEVIAAIPGDRALEKLLHEKLAEIRVERELFQPDYRISSFIRYHETEGLEFALKFLDECSPAARAKKKEEDRGRRVAEARRSRAEKDAHFASLVAERKNRLGW